VAIKQQLTMARATSIAVALMGLTSVGVLVLDANAGQGQSSGLVAYVRYPGEKGGISVVPAPGGRSRAVTFRHGAPWYFSQGGPPVWSPDGRWIAFVDSRNVPKSHRCLVDDDYACPSEIYAIRPDGSGEHAITKPSEGTGSPVWSPDSLRLLYPREGKLYLVNADGTGERRLTRNRRDFYEVSPSWSPDGKEVAFEGTDDIYVVRLDGSQRRITDTRVRRNGGPFSSPSWSPDGKWIAFIGYKPFHQGFFKLFLTSPRGTSTRTITPPSRPLLSSFAWSPSGDRIAYDAGTEAHEQGLWLIDIAMATHERVVRVTGLQSWNDPSWSPSGDQLVLGFSISGNPQGCFVVDAERNGKKKRLIARGHSCTWQPARR
jgi:Tol biopolymer transport system component